MKSVRLVAVALVLVGSVAACGSDVVTPDLASTPTPAVSESTPTPDGATVTDLDLAPPVPTRNELAAAQLTPAVLGEGWEVLEDFASGEIHGPGNFCHDSQEEYGEWYVETRMVYGRNLEQTHFLVLGQQLTSGEPEQMRALFDELTAAMQACNGAEWDTFEEGHLRSELMGVPPVGEAGFGLLVHSDGFEVSDGITAVADSQQAAVLDGPVLVFLTLGEFREPRLAPMGAEVDFTEILTIAVDRLPD